MSLPAHQHGYTLIEILASFFIMTVILTLVTGIFVENGRQRAAALGMMRESKAPEGRHYRGSVAPPGLG